MTMSSFVTQRLLPCLRRVWRQVRIRCGFPKKYYGVIPIQARNDTLVTFHQFTSGQKLHLDYGDGSSEDIEVL